MSSQVGIGSSHSRKLNKNRHATAYAYLAPAMVTIAVLSITPILYTIYIAFTNFNQMHFQTFQFVGFKNFRELLDPNNPLSQLFLPTLLWTFLYAIATTSFSYLIGLFVAVLLNNKNMKEAAVYRAILIIPWAVPTLITMLAWQGLLNDSYGQINGLLHWLGLPRVPWLTNPTWARVGVVLANVWTGFPYMMTVSLGALQAIPGDLYEAGAIDGASWWQQFRFITMPDVWKLTLPLVIPSFAFNFNNFNGIYLITQGNPARSTNQFVGHTDILASAAYKMTLTFNRYDLAAAVSILLFLIVGILSFFQMRYTGAFKEADE